MPKLKKHIPGLIVLTLIALASFAVIAQIAFFRSWPDCHDELRYIYVFDLFKDSFKEGIMYPRWLPGVYGGYGSPLFVFYQPGFFYVALFFSFLFGNALTIMYWTIFSFIFLGGLGSYFLTRKITDSRITGLFCALLFLLTPYLYVNLYVRGDLSELAAMLLCPWPFYFLLRLKDKIVKKEKIGPSIALLGISTSAIIFCHPAVTLFFMPTFCLIAVYLLFSINKKKRVKYLLGFAAGVFLGLTISSPYWVTAFSMKRYSHHERATTAYFSAEKHVVHFRQFFLRKWGFGESGKNKDDMSFQLGLIHFIISLAGFILMRQNRFIQACFGCYILLILSMTPLSSLLWEYIPIIRYAQFPWRILSVTATLQCVCATGLIKMADKNPKRNLIQTCVFAGIIACCIIWNKEQFAPMTFSNKTAEALIEKHREVRSKRFYVYQVSNEMMPKTARMPIPKPRENTPLIQVSSSNCSIEKQPDCTPDFIHFEISATKPMKVLINQLYFPGQQIILNGIPFTREQKEKYITQDGRTFIDIPAGENQELTVFYEGPPGWKIRNILIGIILIAYILFIYLENKKISDESIADG
jgi:hypothetical protein